MPPNKNSLEPSSRIRYGVVSWPNYLHIALVIMCLPINLAYSAVFGRKHARAYTRKPLKRRITDAVMYASFSLTIAETQWACGNGLDMYRSWAKRENLECIIHKLDLDLEDHTHNHLLWIGQKRTDKVILYMPGGAHHFPATAMMLKFCRYLQLEWKKQGLDVGIALLSYTILPEGGFPDQLRQAVSALEHLFAIGCKPSNIQLAGDSAGGNLILQLFSHILHPLPEVQPLNLPRNERFRGACLMSPWVSLTKPEQWGDSFPVKDFDQVQFVSRSYTEHIPDSQIAYAEPILVPDDWYRDLNNILDRILVSTGSEEIFLDQDVVLFEKKVKPYIEDAILEVQDGGLHDDPLMDFFVFNEPLENTLTPIVVEWIAKGFQ